MSKRTPQKVISNRFRELLVIRGRKEGRTISQREVAAVTGLAKTTVDRYARNEVTRYDTDALLALCEYLGVGIGELLVIEEIDSPETETPLDAIA